MAIAMKVSPIWTSRYIITLQLSGYPLMSGYRNTGKVSFAQMSLGR